MSSLLVSFLWGGESGQKQSVKLLQNMVHNTTKSPKNGKVNSYPKIDRDYYRSDRNVIQVSWLSSYVKVFKNYLLPQQPFTEKVYFVCRLEQQADERCRLQLYTLDVYFHQMVCTRILSYLCCNLK